MAYTVSKEITVFGNKSVSIINLTADAATQAVETGLSRIDGFSLGIISMTTTSSLHVAKNSNASGVQSFGVLGISGATSGDDLCIIAYGPR